MSNLTSLRNPRRNSRLLRRGVWTLAAINLAITLIMALSLSASREVSTSAEVTITSDHHIAID